MSGGLTTDQKRALQRAAGDAIAYRDGLPDRPANPSMGVDAAIELFRKPLPDTGRSAEEVIAAMVRDAADGIHQMTAPSFFAYVCGASHPVGMAADMLVSAWGQNAASSTESPSVAAMERAVCDWVLDLLDLPRDAGVGIVTGASVANFSSVLSARHMLLKAQGWDVEEDGLFGAPAFPVILGADAHSATTAALRYAGIGAGKIMRVATDDQGRMQEDALREALAQCQAPPLVILQAGQINTGAFDPFDRLIPMVRDMGGWVHVDGAFGLWVRAEPELSNRSKGVELADSWAVDLHKWLNAPFDAGMVIVRDRAALVAAMTARGAYLPEVTEAWEPSDSTPELSRRARGVPSYAILQHLGRDGVRAMVRGHCALAERIATGLRAIPGVQVMNDIHCNQVALTIGEGAEGDALTNRVLARVQAQGKVYPSHGEWHGRQIIRVSVIGYAMRDQHGDLLVQEIADALAVERSFGT